MVIKVGINNGAVTKNVAVSGEQTVVKKLTVGNSDAKVVRLPEGDTVTAGVGSQTIIKSVTVGRPISSPINADDNLTRRLLFQGDTGSDTLYFASNTLSLVGGTGLSSTVTNNQVQYSLDSSGVTSGTYGSATRIPILSIDRYGRVDSAGSVEISTGGDISNIIYDSATGALTINTSNGSTFIDSINLNPFTTNDLIEGSNLYYTDERVDDRVNNLLLAGEAIGLTYNDSAGTLQMSVELATATNPGAASFDSSQFAITAGAVALNLVDGGSY